MADQRDSVLVEQAKIQRMRLASALLYGHIGERRTVNDNIKRLMGSIVIAAVACAACVGVSFVTKVFADQADARDAAAIVAPVIPETPAPEETP